MTPETEVASSREGGLKDARSPDPRKRWRSNDFHGLRATAVRASNRPVRGSSQEIAITDPVVISIIQNRFEQLGSWKAVAEELGLNRGLVYQLAHGQVKSSEKAKKAVRVRYGGSLNPDQPRQLNLF